MKKYFPLLVFFVFLILAGCTGLNDKQLAAGEGAADSSAFGDHVSDSSRSLKAFILPAPLQVATAIRSFNINYSDKLLVPTNKSVASYPTNYLKALNLGISGIDLGYATVYENKQTAIYYLSKVQKFTEELGISGSFDAAAVRRFKSNIENQDSLYYIILESFNNVHRYLHENDRTSAGLLMLTGSFIEGLYLTTGFAERHNDTRLNSLIARQQVFLDNLIDLLQNYKSQQEIAELVEQLKGLKTTFHGVSDTAGQGAGVSAGQLQSISDKVSEIRNKMVGV